MDSWIRMLSLRFRALFRSGEKESEMEREMRFHLEHQIEENIESGMSPDEARKEAMKGFGNAECLKEDCRDSWGTRVVTDLIRNVRFGLRLMVQNLGSSVMAIMLMAIGLGVTITIFTFVNGFLWSRIDAGSSEKMLHLEWKEQKGVGFNQEIIPEDYLVFEKELRSFKKLAAFRGTEVSLNNPSGEVFNKRYSNSETSWSFFDLIGVPPLLGRTYDQSDEIPGGGGSSGLTVISYDVWQEQFGGDENAIGADIYLDGWPYRVIGIMPAGFSFPRDQDVWVPSYWDWSTNLGRNRGTSLEVVGILNEGYDMEEAQTELNLLAGRFAEQYPETNEHKTEVEIKTFEEEALGEQFSNLLLAMLLCSMLVLLVACVNVFNLVMARASKRSFELALRNVLGASRSNLASQVLIDGIVISVFGLAIGLILASWGSGYVWRRISEQDLFFWWHMNMDGRVIVFSALVMVGAALVSSLVPAFRASRSANYDIIKDSGRTASGYFIGRLSKGLVVLQVLFSSLLVFTAVVMFILSARMKYRDYPYEPDSVLMASVLLHKNAGYDSDSRLNAFIDNLNKDLAEVPGIRKVEATTAYGTRYDPVMPFEILGETYDTPEDRPSSVQTRIGPSYFDVFGMSPLIGRVFNQFDTEDSEPVCLVNKTLADRFWPEGDALGKLLRIDGEVRDQADPVWLKIVGVVPDVLPSRLPGEPIERYSFVYRPFRQSSARFVCLMMTGDGDVREYTNDLRRLVQKQAPLLMPMNIQTIQEFNDRQLVGQNVISTLFFVFGVAALFKATIGVYAVISFAAKQKTKEIGIRRALGSSNWLTIKLVLSQNWRALVIGCSAGIVAGHFVSREIGAIINATELPFGYAYPIVLIVMLFSAALSCGIPAWGATRISPTTALEES